MGTFESIFIPFESDSSLQPQSVRTARTRRLKMGEIFFSENDYTFVCIHCSTEFTNFATFTGHTQEHLMHLTHIHKSMWRPSTDSVNVESEPKTNDMIVDDEQSVEDAIADCEHTTFSDAENDNDSFASENDSAEERELLQCPLCSETFITTNGLETHLKIDHKRNYMAGTIELVDKRRSVDSSNKNAESNTQRPVEQKPIVPCSSRDTAGEYEKVLERLHKEGIDLDSTTTLARDYFQYIYDFDHITAGSIDIFQCPKCSFTCRQMNRTRTHIFKHLTSNIFICIQCKRSFHRVGAVRQHIKKTHIRRKGSSIIPPKEYESDDISDMNRPLRRSQTRTKPIGKVKAECLSSSSSDSSSNEDGPDDSDYEPQNSIRSDTSLQHLVDEPEMTPAAPIVPEEKQSDISLTADDFQQHAKAQVKFKQKYIEISDTPAAIEFAKYALMSDFRYSDNFFQCPRCPQTSNKFMGMRRHIFTHLKEKIFTCMFCRRKSNRLQTMEWHVSDHVKTNSKNLFQRLTNDAEKDGKIDKLLAMVRKRLNPHCIQLENSPDGIRYAKYYLLEDMRMVDGHYECPQCHALMISRNSFRKHLFRHIKSDVFSCMICNEKSAAYELIRRHMKVKHSNQINDIDKSEEEDDEKIDEKRVLCTICGTSVKSNGLKKHMTIHDRNADFKCDLCDKSFLRKCKLLEHRRTHPSPMPYHCVLCNKGYILKKGLVRHLATHGKDV